MDDTTVREWPLRMTTTVLGSAHSASTHGGNTGGSVALDAVLLRLRRWREADGDRTSSVVLSSAFPQANGTEFDTSTCSRSSTSTRREAPWNAASTSDEINLTTATSQRQCR